MAQVVGDYEYIKPKQSVENLTLRADRTVTYEEKGDNGLETYVTSGNGHWELSNGIVKVSFAQLRKEMNVKGLKIVPGIESGVAFTDNVVFQITENELANAPKHGTHKWRRK